MDLWGSIIVANKNPWTLNIQSLPPEVNGGFTPLPKTNSKQKPLKIGHPKKKLSYSVFQPSIFGCKLAVSFREGRSIFWVRSYRTSAGGFGCLRWSPRPQVTSVRGMSGVPGHSQCQEPHKGHRPCDFGRKPGRWSYKATLTPAGCHLSAVIASPKSVWQLPVCQDRNKVGRSRLG